MKRSRDFYENILKQKVKFDFGENVTYEGDFAIHLQSHFKSLIGDREIKSGGNNFELYFELDQPGPAVDKMKEKNVEFVHELREQPWRQLVVRIYDPDKNIIEIGESMEYLCFRLKKEGLSPEQISEKSMMPVEFVNMAIKKYEA